MAARVTLNDLDHNAQRGAVQTFVWTSLGKAAKRALPPQRLTPPLILGRFFLQGTSYYCMSSRSISAVTSAMVTWLSMLMSPGV